MTINFFIYLLVLFNKQVVTVHSYTKNTFAISNIHHQLFQKVSGVGFEPTTSHDSIALNHTP